MQQKVSMSSLAKMFNVSKVTISKALNDKEVSEELRSRSSRRRNGISDKQCSKRPSTNKMYNIGLLIAERYRENQFLLFRVCGKMVARLAELNYSSIMETLTDKMENELVCR